MLLFYGFAAVAEEERLVVRGAGISRRGLEIGAWALAGFGVVVALYFLSTHDWDRFDVKIAPLVAAGRVRRLPHATPGRSAPAGSAVTARGSEGSGDGPAVAVRARESSAPHSA